MKKKRKIIMITIAIIVLGLLLTLLFTGKPAKVKTNKELAGVSDDIENALYYASFAANSHNTQGWKLELDPVKQQITILADNERALDIVDPEHRELYISIGCYIESLVNAFKAYGYNTTVDYANISTPNSKIATITYDQQNDAKILYEQLELIKLRHTDKSKFLLQPIEPNTMSDLTDNNQGIYSYELDTKEFEYLRNGTLEAITIQSTDNSYRQELNLWMRFSNKEVEQKKDGISAEMIGLNGIIKSFYYLTTNHKNATNDTFADQGIKTAENQVMNCSAFFVITGEQTPLGWIEAGRKTQAFWYECVKKNIAIQPMSAMLEVAPFKDSIENELGLSQHVQMILRAGYVDEYGKNAGVRRDLNEYITVVE